MLDNEFVRSQFPAFSEPGLQGQAFFENAGGSYTCGQVIDRLVRFYRARKIQPYYPHPASQLGGQEMDESRVRLAGYLGIEPDALSFGPSTTQNTYVMAQAFREHLVAGDAIIVTNQDHEANSGPWRRLADNGLDIREWRVDSATGSLDTADLAPLLDDNVKLVCFPHCSNLLGEINDVENIVSLIHGAGAYACVDGVSFAPHGLPDLGKLGADIYLFSSYKTFGPHQGIMYIDPALAQALPNQGHYFNGDTLYKRFTPAGPDHAQVAACAGMVDYFEAVYQHHHDARAQGTQVGKAVNELIADYETTLLQPLLDFVVQKRSLRLLGPARASRRAPTVSFMCKANATEVVTALAAQDIIAGCGNYYALRLMDAMELDARHGAVRVSFTHYTSKEEVSRLIAALDQIT